MWLLFTEEEERLREECDESVKCTVEGAGGGIMEAGKGEELEGAVRRFTVAFCISKQ